MFQLLKILQPSMQWRRRRIIDIQQSRITGWDEAVLAPKNLNKSNQPEQRAKIPLGKHRIQHRNYSNKAKQNVEQTVAMQTLFSKFYRNDSRDHEDIRFQRCQEKPSNINNLKKLMENLQKCQDRWQIDNNYQPNIPHNVYKKKRVHSGYIRPKVPTENTENASKELIQGLNPISQELQRKIRPMSSRTSQSTTLVNRSQTIHSRCGKRSVSARINTQKSSRSDQSTLMIRINQIDPSKMRTIASILSNQI